MAEKKLDDVEQNIEEEETIQSIQELSSFTGSKAARVQESSPDRDGRKISGAAACLAQP